MHYKQRLQNKIHQIPVHINHTQTNYRVFVGPFTNINTLHKISQQLLVQKQPLLQKHIKPIAIQHKVTKVITRITPPTTVITTPSMHASYPVDLSIAIGPQWINANTAYMRVTSTDTNADVISNTSTNALYSIGVGYHPLQTALANRKYLNDFLIQLNYYYTTGNLKGQAWDYLTSTSNNQFFKAALHSSRLAIDLKPQLFTYRSFSPYLIAGAGASWNTLSYFETPNGDYAVSSIRLNAHTNQNIMYDLGVGINAQWRPNIVVSLEYLYTSLGNLSPSSYSQSAQSIISPPAFNIATNALLGRITWKFADHPTENFK